MRHGLVCELVETDGGVLLEIYDSSLNGSTHQKEAIFTILPEDARQAIGNESLMQQLGENILIRLAASNGIKL